MKMKKSAFIFATCLMLICTSSQAQSLKNILNGVSKAVESVTGGTSVSLPGTWSYTGPAIALKSDNTLSNVAGSAVSAGIESKISTYLEKAGIKPGAVSFTFNEDKSFSCTISKVPMNGTWSTSEDGANVTLKFGKNLKFFSMTGSLKGSLDGTCEILFNADKFMSFVKTAMAYVGKTSGTVSTITSLADNYDSYQMGFKLKKAN